MAATIAQQQSARMRVIGFLAPGTAARDCLRLPRGVECCVFRRIRRVRRQDIRIALAGFSPDIADILHSCLITLFWTVSLRLVEFANGINGPLHEKFAANPLAGQVICRTLNRRVPGSSPGAPTTFPKSFNDFKWWGTSILQSGLRWGTFCS
jgi:hypothetical protein